MNITSPIMTGAYFHEYALATDLTPKHYIDVIGDSPEAAEIRPEIYPVEAAPGASVFALEESSR